MTMVDYNLLGTSVGDFLNSVYGGWIVLASALVIISSAVAGIVYMVGAFLQNDKVKTWAKIEFVEIAYSLILFVLTLSFLGVANNIIGEIAKDDPFSTLVCSASFDNSKYYESIPCHIRLGMHFMNSLFNEGRGVAYDIYKVYIFTSAIAEMNINLEVITEQAGVFAYNPLKGFFVVPNTVKSILFDYNVKIMTILKFQEVLLRFIALALFPVLFLIGIVLRSFFFTRKLGGLLMALALSLYFIYPMFYVVGGQFYNAFKLKAVAATSDSEASALKYLYVDMSGFPTLGGPLDLTQIEGSITGVPTPNQNSNTPSNTNSITFIANNAQFDLCKKISDVELEQKNKIIDEKKSSLVDQLRQKNLFSKSLFLFEIADPGGSIDSASRLSFFSLFFSFLGVMASIAATKSLSGLFGGDLEIAGLTHLI